MQTKSLVQRRIKGSAAKIYLSCPDVINLYKKDMGGVDLVYQRTATYYLDRKSSTRFYLRIFFDLMDVAYANSYIGYNMLHPDDLTLLNFKTALATNMIEPYTSRKRSTPDNNNGSKRTYKYKQEPTDVPNHLPEFQQNRTQCADCYVGGIDRKTFVRCSEYGVFLCTVKERNSFYKHSC